ncbi:hypothetical protein KJ925_05085 [Patescibacteria group bacterium]|nr:hypothetical protein [Patescibacteria group bacterium]
MATTKLDRVGESFIKLPKKFYDNAQIIYIARLEGLDSKFGFKRVFLKRVRGLSGFYQTNDFILGMYYEFRYITLPGNVKCNDIFRLKDILFDSIVFETVDEKEVIQSFDKQKMAGENMPHAIKLIREAITLVGVKNVKEIVKQIEEKRTVEIKPQIVRRIEIEEKK